jgi:hypothetical protein
MNRIITLLITLAFIFNCKSEQKKDKAQVSRTVKVAQSIILPNHSLWSLNRLTLIESKKKLNDSEKQEFLLYRTSTFQTAYASVNNIPVESGNYYRASILVKKDGLGVSFGLRIIGEYPNRVDAVFDLEKGLIKGVSDVGTFIKGAAKIEDMGEGWYKCSLTAKTNTEIIKIILGPSSDSNSVITWESANEEISSICIIPSSLGLNEVLP